MTTKMPVTPIDLYAAGQQAFAEGEARSDGLLFRRDSKDPQTVHFGPDWPAQLHMLLDHLTKVANWAIEIGKNHGNDFPNHQHVGSDMLRGLASIEASIQGIADPASRRSAEQAVAMALKLACDYHKLTVLDFEQSRGSD